MWQTKEIKMEGDKEFHYEHPLGMLISPGVKHSSPVMTKSVALQYSKNYNSCIVLPPLLGLFLLSQVYVNKIKLPGRYEGNEKSQRRAVQP